MATTLVTLVGDVTDAIATDFSNAKVSLRYNTSKIVTDGDEPIYLGGGIVAVQADGTFTLPNVVAATSLVENLQATVYIDYADPATRQRATATFGPYDLSAETGTVDIRDLEEAQALDPSFASDFMAQAQELLAAQITISGIDDTDAAVAALIEDALIGPLTRAALSASFDRLYRVTGPTFTAAIAEVTTAGAGVLWVPKGETVTITAGVEMPPEVKGLRVDGTLVIDGNFTVLTRSGSTVGDSANITAPILAGARTVSCVAPAGLAVGDTVMVVSSDTLPGTTDKLGYLRFIKAIDTGAGSVTFESAIPRNMPDVTRRLRKVELAEPFVLFGDGEIYNSDPDSNTVPMIDFLFVDRPVVTGNLRIHHGGDRAIVMSHCNEGFVDASVLIEDLLDDVPNDHVGYGVELRGASRNCRLLHTASRVRHAWTTNVGPANDDFNFYGEPENFYAHCPTYGCTDKANDTHRAGWGGTIVVQDKGSGGACQVRADNTLVASLVSDGAYVGGALAVGADLVVPPTIGPAVITNCQSAAAIVLYSDAHFTTAPKIINPSGDRFSLNDGALPRYTSARAGAAISSGPRKSGNWVATPAVSVSTGAHGASGTLTFTPVDIPDGYTIDALAFEVTTLAASSALRVGVYDSDDGGLPRNLLAEFGTGASDAVAVVTVTPGTVLPVSGGRYWLAALSEGGSPSTRKSQALSGYGANAADVLSQMRGGFYASGVSTGALPSTAPALTSTSNVTRIAAQITAL